MGSSKHRYISMCRKGKTLECPRACNLYSSSFCYLVPTYLSYILVELIDFLLIILYFLTWHLSPRLFMSNLQTTTFQTLICLFKLFQLFQFLQYIIPCLAWIIVLWIITTSSLAYSRCPNLLFKFHYNCSSKDLLAHK